MDKLETLDLSENRIDILDPSASKLFKLKKLDLKGNAIKVDIGRKEGIWSVNAQLGSHTYMYGCKRSLRMVQLVWGCCRGDRRLDWILPLGSGMFPAYNKGGVRDMGISRLTHRYDMEGNRRSTPPPKTRRLKLCSYALAAKPQQTADRR